MNKLLSICIPTWNRSATLDKALSSLLPQVQYFSEEIEIIICDNYSEDNTKNVISEHVSKYDELRIIVFYQIQNTGFYGNFKKCKQLATGKFIWLLSDDDFVKKDVIKIIIEKLISIENNTGIIFLRNKVVKSTQFDEKRKTVKWLFLKYNYELTLISSSIFINNKENDDNIFSRFQDSHLIGFALLCNVFHFKTNAVILEGEFLQYRLAVIKGYNLFDAFVFDITKIFQYMLEIGYPTSIIRKIKYNLVKHTWAKRYFYLKAKGHLDGELETYTIDKVDKILYSYFGDTKSYWLYIYPLKMFPKIILRITFPFIEKARNFIKKY